MIVYRRLNFTWLPWIRSFFEPADGGWSILCFAKTMKDCDDAIAKDQRGAAMVYEYRVEVNDEN